MHLLSIESSTAHFGLAVSAGDRVLKARTQDVRHLLENSIIRAVDRLLDAAGVPFRRLDGFVVGIGPGSFTSLRIGLSTVKAFALATGKPVAGVCSLDVIAAAGAGAGCDQICVCVDARRNLLYSSLYTAAPSGRLQGTGPALGSLDSVLANVRGHTLFMGDGVGIYRGDIERAYKAAGRKGCRASFAPEKDWAPNPRRLAALGYQKLSQGGADDPAALLPIYGYAQDCQVTTPGKA